MRKLGDKAGVSLLEMLIALVLTGIITTAILRVYTTQHSNYIIQDDVSNIQQNARATIDELTRNIRMAGYDLPPGIPAIVAANTNPDTITVAFRSNGCDTYLSAKMPNPSSELKCATSVSCFYDGQWVYIYEPGTGYGEWFEISHVQDGSNHLQHNTMTLSKAYDSSAVVVSIEYVKFFVDVNTANGEPLFMVQPIGQSPQPYAENIMNLQFRYRLFNDSIVDQPVMADIIREVQIIVIGQSNHPLDGENGSPRHTRAYRSSVYVRNLKG